MDILYQFSYVNQVVANLIAIRKKFKVSQEEIAFDLDLSRTTISKIESEKQELRYNYIEYYSKRFNLAIDQIVNWHKGNDGVSMVSESEVAYSTKKDREIELLNELLDERKKVMLMMQDRLERAENELKQCKEELQKSSSS